MKHSLDFGTKLPDKKKAEKIFSEAVAFLKKGDLDNGIQKLEELLAIAPGSVPVLMNLGKAHMAKKQLAKSGEYFEAVIDKNPDHIEALINLAQIYLQLRQYEKAEQLFELILEKQNNCIPALMGLSTVMGQTKNIDKALLYLDKILDIEPSHNGAILKKITLLEFTGDLSQALKEAEKVSGLSKGESDQVDLVKARIFRREKKLDRAAEILESLKSGNELPFKSSVYFQLGKVYDSQNKTDKAFKNIEMANADMAKSFAAKNIDKSFIPDRLDKLKRVFTKDFVSSLNIKSAANERSPVFLIGFPRSGTTLLDQILSSHPSILVAEEQPVLASIRKDLGDDYPDKLIELKSDALEGMRNNFFLRHNISEDTDCFIDKMPLNMHDAGLAYLLFPDAKFILAQRHPFDCVLSCFMQEFTLNPAMVHFLDLADAAAFYDQSFSLWEQYCSLLPLKTHYIRYEDVISDFKSAVSALLSFLDQPWDDTVLSYDQTAKAKGAINTPSYHQVTEKIYDSARYRWKRYETHIEPIKTILSPWVKKYGYDL